MAIEMKRRSQKADVVIAGGGASGLAAAIELGMRAPELSVLVIEKMDEPGKKLRATGSGRCNITNTEAAGFERIMSFFDEIGLATKSYDNGLVYPHSESASDVVRLLTDRAAMLGTRFAFGEELMSVKHLPAALASGQVPGSSSVFLLESVFKDRDGLQSVLTEASFVILAMGGKSGPTYGTIGDGYRIARNLGHSVVTPVPALTGIECEEWQELRRPCAISLAGTRTRGRVTLFRKSEDAASDCEAASSGCDAVSSGCDAVSSGCIEVFSEEGEIQFTKYGLSGICVFNMTRHMRYNRKAGESIRDFLITADLCPDADIAEIIRSRQKGLFSEMPAGSLLCTVLKEPVADFVMQTAASVLSEKNSGCLPENNCFGGSAEMLPYRTAGSLSDEEIDTIAGCVHSLKFHPSGIRGWNDAQVTMGGVSADEIDELTSESKLIPGLYITGELADRDFPCGGFNLSNAWITGLAAADDICKKRIHNGVQE